MVRRELLSNSITVNYTWYQVVVYNYQVLISTGV